MAATIHSDQRGTQMKTIRILSASVALGLLVAAAASADEQMSADGIKSLLTATPTEGLALAIRLSRDTVTSIQTDKSVLKSQRSEYAHDAADLISASEVVAVHFRTVAEANDYWRD